MCWLFWCAFGGRCSGLVCCFCCCLHPWWLHILILIVFHPRNCCILVCFMVSCALFKNLGERMQGGHMLGGQFSCRAVVCGILECVCQIGGRVFDFIGWRWGWGFCVFGKQIGCCGDALAISFRNVESMTPAMFHCWASAPGLLSMGRPAFSVF